MFFELNNIESESYYNRKLKKLKRAVIHFISTGCMDKTMGYNLLDTRIFKDNIGYRKLYIISDKNMNVFSYHKEYIPNTISTKSSNNAHGVRYSFKEARKRGIKKKSPKNLKDLILAKMVVGETYSVDRMAIDLNVSYKNVFNMFLILIREGRLSKDINTSLARYYHHERTSTTYTFKG